ncbi:MAG TPA: sugar kinase, partial [Planctomycetota bacterium]|nr:sugar kinase [Planctomycetota bacterium]
MSLLVVGSVALDTIKTPHGDRHHCLGGAACFFSVGASSFTDLRLVGVIGSDFPSEHVDMLRERGIDVEGLERRENGLTFRWSGEYVGRMDSARTLDTKLNVLGDFRPALPEHYKQTPYVFLANTDPNTQLHVREQLKAPKF